MKFYRRIRWSTIETVSYAHESAEPQLGALLPCNVVVQQFENGTGVSVSLLKPAAMFEIVDNEAVQPIVENAVARLQRGLESV